MRELIERLEEGVTPVELVNRRNGEFIAVPNDQVLVKVATATRSAFRSHKDGYYVASSKNFQKIADEFFKLRS